MHRDMGNTNPHFLLPLDHGCSFQGSMEPKLCSCISHEQPSPVRTLCRARDMFVSVHNGSYGSWSAQEKYTKHHS